MSLVSPDDVNAVGGGGGLSDATLQDLIDREEAEIIRRYGAHYVNPSTTITATREGGGPNLFLNRPILSVSSIAEYMYLGDTASTLLTSEYFVWANQGRIQRLGSTYATQATWGAYATVVYVPQDDSTLRAQVIIELVRIAAAQQTGIDISGYGYSIKGRAAQEWQRDRAEQYNRLSFIGV